MSDNSSNTKRVAKNTIFLYVRMLLIMFISFFTSRVVLDKLGVVDFGINNVVGGLATMFTFFSSALANATQRYLNIELGRNDFKAANLIFNQHFLVYVGFVVAIIIVAESIGVWMIGNKLVIPPDRIDAAYWVFHLTIISLCITFLGIVFNSVIIAHENMKIYSYVGIAESLAKLAIVYVLSVTNTDRLITYALLLLIVTICVQGFFAVTCFRKYPECRFNLQPEGKTIRQTFSFIGWNVIGTAVYAVNDQGINMLLNMFFGPVVNAARGISYQVNSAITNFGSNFFVALNPQLVKSYASKDYEYMLKLFYGSSKYAVYLMWLLSFPMMLCIDYILSIWLKEVPSGTGIFTKWILAYSVLNMLSNPIWTLILAVGKLKKYIIIGSSVFLMVFPLSFVLLKNGCPAVSVFIAMFFVRAVYIWVVLYILRLYIDFSFLAYLKQVILPILFVIACSSVPCLFIAQKIYVDNILSAFIMIACSMTIILLSIYLVGLSVNERNTVITTIKSKILRK